jgi:hypothetical protein
MLLKQRGENTPELLWHLSDVDDYSLPPPAVYERASTRRLGSDRAIGGATSRRVQKSVVPLVVTFCVASVVPLIVSLATSVAC